MPKAASGQGNIYTQPGRSHFQKIADPILTEEGFIYEKRSGKSANVYKHPDGRRITVSATPRNEGVALGYLKQSIRSPRLNLKAGQSPTEGSQTMTTPKTEGVRAAELVAMADSFLLKKPTSMHGARARNNAYTAWLKRVLERHGPITQELLMDASDQMGFAKAQVQRSRLDAGAVSYIIPGVVKGPGKGQQIYWVALPHQVPENATVRGDKSPKPAQNGVVPVQEDPAPVAESPQEPAQEPAPEPRGYQSDVPPAPVPESDTERARALYSTLDPKSQEVLAAAQMLLDSLGLKTMDPMIVQIIREAEQAMAAAEDDLRIAKLAMTRVLRLVS